MADAEAMSSSAAQARDAADLVACFSTATAGSDDAVLQKPGSAGAFVLLASCGFEKDVGEIKQCLVEKGWTEELDYVYADFYDLCVMLGCVEPVPSQSGNDEEAKESIDIVMKKCVMDGIVLHRFEGTQLLPLLPVTGCKDTDSMASTKRALA